MILVLAIGGWISYNLYTKKYMYLNLEHIKIISVVLIHQIFPVKSILKEFLISKTLLNIYEDLMR